MIKNKNANNNTEDITIAYTVLYMFTYGVASVVISNFKSILFFYLLQAFPLRPWYCTGSREVGRKALRQLL